MTAQAILEHLVFGASLAALSALLVRLMIAFPILDHPDHRKAHVHPTPKGGGIGIVAAFMAGMLALFLTAQFARVADRQFIGVILAALAIAALALADDVKNFRFVVKLGAQALAALVAVASGLTVSKLALPWIGVVELGWLGPALTLFWIVACTNAVNFMDGLDSLVGSVTLITCTVLAVLAGAQGGWFLYAACLILGAGILGFLPFNLPPARIFMGDVGSQFLGFILAVLGVAAARFDAAQLSFLLVPLLLFALLFDTGFTLLRRAWMGERVSTPHRTHLYQMAQRSGMSVPAVAATHAGFALFQGALALSFAGLPGWAKPLVILPPLAVQLLWLAYVVRRVRRAGLSWKAG
ncbi:undecaprenyl/decaprenyl-phosphate alpha-N-acetylglucosaminyl 1-phosphate transferase [Pseudoroseomonas wenyumeiae]|uniref:Undecaprenyl/decaprenyl-phosphate alpha-N-acetylglucosaminyl 1-phosphate transferase n=1 Tax=Teichococcus wenyumeiae TaxID=2478470 RepID=A0A3A9J7G5_9PROT|nr:MraY family glycosyltransferase [Pseudoroseomonas wenyumeiae]RKK03167.1 undecaprenyl/decaprenyl-phosphate alpha-N-acetylglucosaminyl 1-phosphate transferase [Pseudoroseomonas wenyumeiae]RMI27132.1 undecaprenyl/decaprenyl-phosphate alpha-N-acetylglucosaminyl 1-phosphate transferase [Pseudoroseomonas wenyumeiae]